MEHSVISLFSGGGGLDLGLERAGFSTRVCVEWERYAAMTLRKNQEAGQEIAPGSTFLQNAEVIEQDIRQLSGKKLLRAAGLKPGQAALLAGGPPCVTFSVAGLREGLTTDT